MQRNYEHLSYTIDVSVEAEPFQTPANKSLPGNKSVPASPIRRYVAIVEIRKDGLAVATFSPLRLGDIAGRPFASEVDAIMGGYSAARKIIEDIFPGA